MFFDQPVAITQPANLNNGTGLKAEYFDNADLLAPKLMRTDANASTTVAQVSTTGKTYYVSGSGNDNNNGLSTGSAFRNLSKVGGLVKAGDTVYVMNGTYTGSGSQILLIYQKHGTPSAPITIKAYPGHSPFVKSRNMYAINIVGSSYINIEGLTLEGNNDNVSLQYAQQQKYNTRDPLTNGIGIGVNEKSRHVVIRKNKVSKFGGQGIHSYKSDYVTIENNVVRQNSYYSPMGTSGISTIYNWNSDSNSGSYKMIIRGNTIYENKNYIPWSSVGKITEGHGIIIDDSLNTQQNSLHQKYYGKTLIVNNIIYKNGGAGVNVYSSAYVDVVNNTTFQNALVPDTKLFGEISVFSSENVKVFNNIMYPMKDAVVNGVGGSKNYQYNYNVIYNSSKFNGSVNNNIIWKDPLFRDPHNGNFALKYGSSAIDRGTSYFNGANAPNTDHVGLSRPQDGDSNGGAVIDIGAIEVTAQAALAK
ncbi:MAG: right-handed parallel beta-helix repeat-containing protein [Mojavia pulchra JT2-VF2]|jgi:parallel beta-helix repeat protein|uniref:Right-handed parallel beta-helix repeat-containing protein n=1 Tax=Mojavia pulchra JT2-VF2 TaxID=287848 RepID=A0A951Q2H9_9NOST|nr:right-handed parallel beta-helix repeat-containing protein [Mojavia pulchra JT2-VF2]